MRSGILAIFAGAALFALAIIPAATVRADEGSVPYPEGYRKWIFLHSSLISAHASGFSKSPCVKPCTNGIFYFYANEPAMKGLRTGTYADGAVIAEEMLEYRINDKGDGGEGKRVRTAVMVKDSKRYAATGGWGFGGFAEGSKMNDLDAKAQETCYECHVSREDHGYVFTQYVDR